MVGKRSRRGPQRDFATLSGLARVASGEAKPTGLGWSSRVWSFASSLPIPSGRRSGTRRLIPGLCRRCI
jgi:hypothetical protein